MAFVEESLSVILEQFGEENTKKYSPSLFVVNMRK